MLMISRIRPSRPRTPQRISYADGCKVYFEDRWIIIRFSGTEPRIRIFAEAPAMEDAVGMVRVAAGFLGLPMKA